MMGASFTKNQHSPGILPWKCRMESKGERFPVWAVDLRSASITETPEKIAPLRGDFHDDPDMHPIVAMFLGELPKRVRDLEAAFETSDLPLFRRLTHQMKGAAGGYGYPSITKAAIALERCVDMSGDTWTRTCRVHLDALVLLLRRAHAAAAHLSQ
jgi:HPt (histidine-containing phosphotransfer) domain-containing protein